MRGLAILTTILLMIAPCAALGEGAESVTASGVVETVRVTEITAPYAGTLLPFDLRGGERFHAGDTILTLDTVKVYAPASGVLRVVFAGRGDSAEDVIAQYGMLAAVEKTPPLIAACDYASAYDDEANKFVHIGETLYFYESGDGDNTGVGRVIAAEQSSYTLEVLRGDFEQRVQIKIYRDDSHSSKQRVGTGRIARAADVPVLGAGRVLRVCASEGQEVIKGQLLFELALDAAPSCASASVTAAHAGVLSAPYVAPGQQVYKGQRLARLYDLSALQVRAEVDEMDLGSLAVGATVYLELDRYPGERIAGTVASISALGVSKQNASYYDVCVVFTTSREALPGMSATVYLR